MYDICCIGHLTLDKVVTKSGTVRMAGGTSFYFSNAIRNLNLRYLLTTILAKEEMHFISDLMAMGIEINIAALSPYTVFFENNYTQDVDHRTQRVLQVSEPFKMSQLVNVEAPVFHLGPLLANDIPIDIIQFLSSKGKVSLDVQGYLRKVENRKVLYVDWPAKTEALQYVHILKANESEMAVLTGSTDVKEAAMILFSWGVKEVVITLGSHGSVIYDGKVFYEIPAYSPVTAVVDATGCGDTYMAGYLYQRIKGKGFQYSGEFAAAMATLKIESSGPFTGSEKEITQLLANTKRRTLSS